MLNPAIGSRWLNLCPRGAPRTLKMFPEGAKGCLHERTCTAGIKIFTFGSNTIMIQK